MSATPRTRLPRAERERQLLASAHALFAERGYAEVTMDEVAAAVGVTKPLLYSYFGNKERLYLACMAPASEALTRAVATAVADAGEPADALRDGVRAFFAFLASERDAWRVLFDDTLPPSGAIADAVGHERARLRGLVVAALTERLPEHARSSARARAQVEALSISLLAAAEALGRWWIAQDAFDAAETADLLISTVEPGLRARTAAPLTHKDT